jgi:hypothetical protein
MYFRKKYYFYILINLKSLLKNNEIIFLYDTYFSNIYFNSYFNLRN